MRNSVAKETGDHGRVITRPLRVLLAPLVLALACDRKDDAAQETPAAGAFKQDCAD
jgi:hypothetical protein